MALINVVKCDISDSHFAWKFPIEDLKLGTQLIVRQSQSAIFVKGGKISDVFGPGTYTLSTGNLPLLNKIVNLPFGGDSPFQAGVWFVNRINKLDNKWGTATPIQVEDPVYGIVVPMRAYGQFGLTIADPRLFLESLVGTATDFSASKMVEYFTGKLLSTVSTRVGKKIVLDRISVLQITVFQDDLSNDCATGIQAEFAKFGVGLVNFAIASINVPENDQSVIKLKEAKELAMLVNTVGRDVYQMDRSFNVLEQAASNEGNSGQIMGAGLGLGLGVGLGNAMAAQTPALAQPMQVSSAPPPLPPALPSFHFAINGAQHGPVALDQIQLLIAQGRIDRNTLAWRAGMSAWTKAGDAPDLASLFTSLPPPLPPPA